MSEVLVVGAGPTGLALAAQLQAHGASVRVVERRLAPRPSRALVVHPRTLEVLETVGLAAPLVARGDAAASVRLHGAGRDVGIPLAGFQLDDTAFPFLLAIPQALVESTLEERLAARGVVVERGVQLTAHEQTPEGVAASLRHGDGREERVAVGYLAGCDGRDSTVRQGAGIAFPGRPYREVLWLADLEVDTDLPRDAVHGVVGSAGILFLFPQGTPTTWRLLAVRPHPARDAAGPSRDELQALADRVAPGRLRLADPVWSAEQRLRRAQAPHYRSGRVVLAGDAAHVHSPAGAQGMNTGIQDAANLGWRLAYVAGGFADPALLDGYEAERWPVARAVRRLTDLAFLAEAGGLPPLPWLRGQIAPRLLPLVDGRPVPAPLLRLVGGLVTRYRRSPDVSEGEPSLTRGPRAGDRLPDAQVRAGRDVRWLHKALGGPGMQLLCCGEGPWDRQRLDALRRRYGAALGVHQLSVRAGDDAIHDPSGRALSRLGVTDSAVYVVRPDGYVGYRCAGRDIRGAERWLAHRLPRLAGARRPTSSPAAPR